MNQLKNNVRCFLDESCFISCEPYEYLYFLIKTVSVNDIEQFIFSSQLSSCEHIRAEVSSCVCVCVCVCVFARVFVGGWVCIRSIITNKYKTNSKTTAD